MKSLNNTLLIRAGFFPKGTVAHPLHIPPSLSLRYTKQLLEDEGLSPRLIDCQIKEFSSPQIQKIVQDNQIQIVLIDITSSAYHQAIKICENLKRSTSVIIIGTGADVSERPNTYEEQSEIFDILIRGEYEEEACRIIHEITKTEDIPSLLNTYRTTTKDTTFVIDDLNRLPGIKWSLQDANDYIYRYPLRLAKKIVSGYISTSRGCKHQCTFCSPSVRKSFGHKLRFRSASRVVDDIESLYKTGINVISFEDDDFTGSKSHVLSICDEILRRKIPIQWTCHARIDEVSHEMLQKMHEAGCILILFGIESGSTRILTVLNKTQKQIDWKEQAMNSLNSAKEIGIAACAMFLVGNISETREDIEESIQLAIQLKPDFIKVHNFTLYPGSMDYTKHIQSSETVPIAHHYQEPILNLSQLDLKTLKRIQIIFYKRFLFRFSFILRHLSQYSLFYIFNLSWSFTLLKDIVLYLTLSNHKKKQSNTMSVNKGRSS